MTRAFRRERKLCWPSCCFLAWGTVSFYIFLPLFPNYLSKTIFLRKKEIALIETFSVHYQLSKEHLGKGKAEGLRQRAFAGLNDPLKEDVRVWKASELLLVTSTWNFILTSATRASTHIQEQARNARGVAQGRNQCSQPVMHQKNPISLHFHNNCNSPVQAQGHQALHRLETQLSINHVTSK